MVTAWRLTHKNRAHAAFSGEGAKQNGGRWNSPGLRVVYTADSLALATLEVIVHAVPYRTLRSYIFFEVEIPEELIEPLDIATLPKKWRQAPPPIALNKIGDRWIRDAVSPVLKIPSAVIPVGSNYMINPDHYDFEKIKLGKSNPFFIDERISDAGGR